MEDLIKRIEEAREGSRELDCKIFKRLNPRVSISFEGDGDGNIDCWYLDYETDLWPRIPEYTTLIDAALGLVPEGCAVQGMMIWPGHPTDVVLVGTHLEGGVYWHNHDDGRWPAKAATPALALTAAALKAIQEMER